MKLRYGATKWGAGCLVSRANFFMLSRVYQDLHATFVLSSKSTIIIIMIITIHAGIHRSGTTTIQRMLRLNADRLAEQGIVYPLEIFAGHTIQQNHQPIAWSLFRGNTSGRDLLEYISQYEQTGCERVLLSAEDFSIHKSLGWIGDLQRFYKVEAIFYLRRQDHWLMSWYNQHVKWPFSKEKSSMCPREFLDSIDDFYWIDYNSLLSLWEQQLGQESVIVRVIEESGVQDTALDLLEHLEINPCDLAPSSGRDNASLPIQALELARHMGLYDMKPAERQRLIRALSLGLADKPTTAKTLYSPAERCAILERFKESNEAVARRYFGRTSLFEEPPPDASDEYFVFPDLTQENLLREWVAPVIGQLVKDSVAKPRGR